MNCALFAKMDKVFSLKNKTLKKYWKMEKKYWKSQGKVREFCQPGKVGTLIDNLNKIRLNQWMIIEYIIPGVEVQKSLSRKVLLCVTSRPKKNTHMPLNFQTWRGKQRKQP